MSSGVLSAREAATTPSLLRIPAEKGGLGRTVDGYLEGPVELVAEVAARNGSGVYRSEVFPGLWLDAPALARGDMARVLEVARQGLTSAEHEELVRRLAG